LIRQTSSYLFKSINSINSIKSTYEKSEELNLLHENEYITIGVKMPIYKSVPNGEDNDVKLQ